MKLKIVQAGEPVLRQRARELTRDEIRARTTQELIEWMRQTMYDAPGVGLAAHKSDSVFNWPSSKTSPSTYGPLQRTGLKKCAGKLFPFRLSSIPGIKVDDGPTGRVL